MRTWGGIFLLVGLGLIGFAFIFDVSAGAGLYGDAVANLDLMNVRQMIHQTGATFAIIGAIFTAACKFLPEEPVPAEPSTEADVYRDQVG